MKGLPGEPGKKVLSKQLSLLYFTLAGFVCTCRESWELLEQWEGRVPVDCL